MKIIIKITEKKLTQSLIKQMPGANLNVLQAGAGNVLGWVQLPKVKVVIIHHDNEYYTQTMGWYQPGDESSPKLYRAGYSRGTHTKPFDSIEKKNVWWKAYSVVVDKAEHIYI